MNIIANVIIERNKFIPHTHVKNKINNTIKITIETIIDIHET